MVNLLSCPETLLMKEFTAIQTIETFWTLPDVNMCCLLLARLYFLKLFSASTNGLKLKADHQADVTSDCVIAPEIILFIFFVLLIH